ncbi:hypothetical protein [Paenibacillus glycanilyticus]|uniref:hypothetical protein n=1 Tax=Paenibacillus glycanilyticus TaxID=126569 RepID=UPI003EB809C0
MAFNKGNRQNQRNNQSNIRPLDSQWYLKHENQELNSNAEPESEISVPVVQKPKWIKKHQFWIGITAIVTIAIGIFIGGMKNYSMKDVVSNGIGKGIPAGTTLISADADADLVPRDYDIEMKKGKNSSRVLIWDFAAEDGDVVTVKVNDVVIAANIQIMHKPVPLEITLPSKVEIVGDKDGGGGITYGIKFPGAANNSSYFNAAPEGTANTYNLTIP